MFAKSGHCRAAPSPSRHFAPPRARRQRQEAPRAKGGRCCAQLVVRKQQPLFASHGQPSASQRGFRAKAAMKKSKWCDSVHMNKLEMDSFWSWHLQLVTRGNFCYDPHTVKPRANSSSIKVLLLSFELEKISKARDIAVLKNRSQNEKVRQIIYQILFPVMPVICSFLHVKVVILYRFCVVFVLRNI